MSIMSLKEWMTVTVKETTKQGEVQKQQQMQIADRAGVVW